MGNKLIIYTDGACSNNPGDGGWGVVILHPNGPIRLSGYEMRTTNQRMEMMAVINAMVFADKNTNIEIYSDSAYVCNCFQANWYVNWRKNGWKNSKGEDVKNKDLWEKMLNLIEEYNDNGCNVKFVKVKGHADNVFNNECDRLAREAISFYRSIIVK